MLDNHIYIHYKNLFFWFCREPNERTFTFKAVLADVIVKHFQHQKSQPLVEIHSQVSHNNWGMLIKLEKR